MYPITFSNVEYGNKNSARHHHSKLFFLFLKLRFNAVALTESLRIHLIYIFIHEKIIMKTKQRETI